MNYDNKSNNNIYKITSNTPTPAPAATNNNITRPSGTQACAACKYQRRKCAPDCILAPYFPHHRQRQFLNAHKLFGVSNITKIIRYLDKHDKDEAMRTIIYQSDVRANDPVGGCYQIIRELQRQIEYNRAELELVRHQLAYCRAQNRFNNVNLLHSNNSALQQISPITTENLRRNSGSRRTYDNHNDEIQQYYHQGDDQDEEQYILHGDDCDDQVHFEEINSWEATESSATFEVKKNREIAENWQEDINAKLLSDDQKEKSFDSVNDFRLKSTPAI